MTFQNLTQQKRPSLPDGRAAYLTHRFMVDTENVWVRNQPTYDRCGGIPLMSRFRHHCFLFQKQRSSRSASLKESELLEDERSDWLGGKPWGHCDQV